MKGEKRNAYILIAVIIAFAIFAAWFGGRVEREFVAYEDYNDFLETVSKNPLV